MRLTLILLAAHALAQVPANDSRNVNLPNTDTHFTMPVYTSREAWMSRAHHLREQILSAAGLLPLPERTPLNAQIFGRIERKGYSVEKVYIETLPGYYLGGNLYRPGKAGKFPGVLSPHGHWSYGRLENRPVVSIPGRAINLARQGYVVFSYDMVGYNDTAQTPHMFGGRLEQLWSFGPLGLQLWNSIRAVDFLQSLPDVDAQRIAATGESGGGTQTFLLTAVDERVKYSVPVNMVSGIMQGGSPCENAPNLRLGTSNVEIAALMAPRPMLLISATGDWTKHVPGEEYPAIRAIYELYDDRSDVESVQIDAEHNYNRQSREAMYAFFAKRVLGDAARAPKTEPVFEVEKLQDLLVWHRRALPENALGYEQLLAEWIAAAKRQTAAITYPAAARARLAYALGVEWPARILSETRGDSVVLSREGRGDRVPGIRLGEGTPSVVVVDPRGYQAARKASTRGSTVLLIDAFQTGSAVAPRDRAHPHFLTFNQTEDANRVQDILTAAAYLKQQGAGEITLQGSSDAAIWCLFAAAVSPTPLRLATPAPASFAGDDQDFLDHFFVPGIQRAGGLQAALWLTANR